MKRKYWVLVGVLAFVVVLGFPVKEDCLNGQKCGALTVTSDNPNTTCVGVVTRPLVATLVGANWYYSFDASDDVAAEWCKK